jgi:ABC-2 type transport system ATP-binding protein
MHRGRLIALEQPGALKRALREPLLELTTDDAPRAVEAIRGAPGVLEAAMFGRAVHLLVEDETAALRDVPHRLGQAGREVRALRRVAPSLEDVFVALVHREGGVVRG